MTRAILRRLRARLLEAAEKVSYWWGRARYWRRRRDAALAHLAELKERLDRVRHQLQLHPKNQQLLNEQADLVAAIKRTNGRIDNRIGKLRYARKRARFWIVVRTRRRAAYKAARELWDQEHRLDFQEWMLNGDPGDIDDSVKAVIAFLVVVRGQYVTDTYGYSGHTPSSLHYPWNDPTPPQQGRAVDFAGTDMAGACQALVDHFGADHFLELFGPMPWYIKNGGKYAIYPYFPGHGDHGHAGSD
jgi:hypothetical protein